MIDVKSDGIARVAGEPYSGRSVRGPKAVLAPSSSRAT